MGMRNDYFGKTPDGDVIERYTLDDDSGFSVGVLAYGARLQSISVPDRRGHIGEVLLGFDALDSYLSDDLYFGAMIGRYANRIPEGRFSLDGKAFELSLNKPKWTLHGGKRGFDKRLWTRVAAAAAHELRLVYQSPHMEQGFPGTLNVAVTFRVEAPSTLRMDYDATADRSTIVNFTHHPYLNLAGAGKGTVHEHVLILPADRYLAIDGFLPTGTIANVKGTVLDFRTPKPIGKDIGKGLATVEGGYDHTYVLWSDPAERPSTPRLAARIFEPVSGRVLEVFTDQPGLQFYTGNELDGAQHGHGGSYQKFGSFTFEPEHFPDSVHHANFPPTGLDPGMHYHTTSIFKFSTEG